LWGLDDDDWMNARAELCGADKVGKPMFFIVRENVSGSTAEKEKAYALRGRVARSKV